MPAANLLDDSPLPNCPTRDVIVTESDRQFLAALRSAPAMVIPRCFVSLHATAWAESLKGAVSGHQSWAVLYRCSCRLLLAGAPKGSDRNAAVEGRQHSRACWKNPRTATLLTPSQEDKGAQSQTDEQRGRRACFGLPEDPSAKQ